MATDDRPPRPSKPLGGAAPPRPGAASARPSSAPRPAPDKVTAAYQDLLQEIVEKKKKAVEVRRKAPKKRKKGAVVKAVLAAILPPVAAALWIFQPFAPPPPVSPRPPDERGAWQMALTDAALRIREWRDSTGALPADLAVAGVPLQGVTYEVHGPESFTLQTFTSEGLVTVWMDGAVVGLGARPVAAPPVEETDLPQGEVTP